MLNPFYSVSLHDDDPAINLAIDEALLDAAQQRTTDGVEEWDPTIQSIRSNDVEYMRIWQFASPVVIVGRGSRVADEVDIEACERDQVPILRRSSGGLAVVAGPGCLLYSVVLSLRARPPLRMLDAAHHFMMESIVSSLQTVIPKDLHWQGICDVTYKNRKCSGNSLRVARDHILYHGTMLYEFPLSLVSRYLRPPHRAPEYRMHRDHDSFLTNVPIPHVDLVRLLVRAFPSRPHASDQRDGHDQDILDRARQLANARYRDPQWTFRH
jgi:lipoate---protein ligase